MPRTNTKVVHSVTEQRLPASRTWIALPQLLSPTQLLFRFCNRKGKFFSRLGQNMWHKREVGVVALCLVRFFLAHHMQNIKSKVCRNRSSEIVSGVKACAHLPS